MTNQQKLHILKLCAMQIPHYQAELLSEGLPRFCSKNDMLEFWKQGLITERSVSNKSCGSNVAYGITNKGLKEIANLESEM